MSERKTSVSDIEIFGRNKSLKLLSLLTMICDTPSTY